MTSSERIKRTLNFKLSDRVGIYDCLWDETLELWRKQNFLPQGQSYQDFFGYDLRLFEFDQSFMLMEKELDSDSTSVTCINSFGVTEKRWLEKSGASQILDTAVKNKKDWQDFKVLLAPCQSRLKSSFETQYKNAKDAGIFLTFACLDPFQHAVNILGLENLLTLMGENPKFVKDIFSASTDLTISMCRFLKKEGFVFDGAWLWADMAYKNGCYFSSRMYKSLLYPYHKKLCSFFNSKNMPVIFHCDGNVLGLVPLLLSAGIRALNPLEIDCGFDLESMKHEYSKKLVIFGNMPADLLEKDKPVIERVLSERINLAKKDSGFICHFDKPISPAVNFENYQFALQLVKKYGSYGQ